MNGIIAVLSVRMITAPKNTRNIVNKNITMFRVALR